jgi:hypothetical protein
LDAEIATDIEDGLKYDPKGPKKDYRRIFRNAEIIDVLTYRDDFAVVTCKESLDGAAPYGGVPFGKINGVWKSLSFGLPLDDSFDDLLSSSAKAVAECVDRVKDDSWRQFARIRDVVLNGRTPTFDSKGGRASIDSTKSEKNIAEKTTMKSDRQPLSLSANEKEDLKRGQRETWRIVITLDMPSLEPPAVLCAIVDKDPVPAFLARFKSLPVPTPEQLAHVRYTPAQFRVTQMKSAWDLTFRDLAGKNYQLLTKRSDDKSFTAGVTSNGPESKRWIITKTVDIKRQPVCWCIPVEVKTGERTEVVLSASNAFGLPAACDKAPMGATVHLVLSGAAKKVLKKLVDDSVRKKFPEITSRETIDWGEVVKAANGNSSIRYKYLAKIHGKDTKIMNQIFTFDANGQFVSAKDLDGFPRNW